MLIFLHGNTNSIKKIRIAFWHSQGIRSVSPGSKPLDTQRAHPAAKGVASQGGAGKARKRPLMASNEKPRRRAGLDGPGEMALRLDCCSSVMEILTDCSSHVNHPTTFDARYWEHSLKPVGEERGAILKSVQRPPIYGHAAHSWEAWRRTGKPVKVANNGWLRQSSIRASGLGLVTPSHRTESPSVIRGITWIYRV